MTSHVQCQVLGELDPTWSGPDLSKLPHCLSPLSPASLAILGTQLTHPSLRTFARATPSCGLLNLIFPWLLPRFYPGLCSLESTTTPSPQPSILLTCFSSLHGTCLHLTYRLLGSVFPFSLECQLHQSRCFCLSAIVFLAPRATPGA